MHELSVMENVLNIVLDSGNRHNAERISRINLTVGALSDIIPRWAQIYFSFAAKGTIAADAEITVLKIPARIRCSSCGNITELNASKLQLRCGLCRSPHIDLISGREFRIDSIEIDCAENCITDKDHETHRSAALRGV